MFRYFLDILQANIFQEKVQSVYTIHYGTPYCLQDVCKSNYNNFKLETFIIVYAHPVNGMGSNNV